MLAFALVTAARRLRPYFQAHPVKVLAESPLGLALVDFVVEVLGFPQEDVAAMIGVAEVEVKSDSQAVVNHVLGLYAMKGERLKKYLARYKISQSIVTDNGSQFDSDHYREWCAKLKIKVKYSSLGHPQANGQAEVTNKALLSILKKRLAEKKGEWADELLGLLWANITSVKTLTGESPFTLAYGCEVVPLVEIGLSGFRTLYFSVPQNDKAREEFLDLLEEEREIAEARILHEKNKAEQYFNKRVRPRTFKIGDLVLKESWVTTKEEGKLGPR
ncbi:uncharacterized protein LOC122304663 [Carya illinoinensis]|uniref:uncharacterized protein LOC122304663 n=1 Tax=Carya illinoinensis TaxID=32201 RepID=UPI001C724A59|nr:uncharacterized protein LOC122304663 [Carya illinoinensis]